VDQHHRRSHAHTRNLRLEGTLILAVEMGHIRRCSPHIEGDDFLEACLLRRADGSHDPARRAGENGILTLEQGRVRQAAIGLHELQTDIAELARHLLYIATQDRRKIGVHYGGITAADELDHRACFVTGGDLRETDLFR